MGWKTTGKGVVVELGGKEAGRVDHKLWLIQLGNTKISMYKERKNKREHFLYVEPKTLIHRIFCWVIRQSKRWCAPALRCEYWLVVGVQPGQRARVLCVCGFNHPCDDIYGGQQIQMALSVNVLTKSEIPTHVCAWECVWCVCVRVPSMNSLRLRVPSFAGNCE